MNEVDDFGRSDIKIFANLVASELTDAATRKNPFLDPRTDGYLSKSVAEYLGRLYDNGLASADGWLFDTMENFAAIYRCGSNAVLFQVYIAPDNGVFACMTRWIRYAGQSLNFFNLESRAVFLNPENLLNQAIICEENVSAPMFFSGRVGRLLPYMDVTYERDAYKYWRPRKSEKDKRAGGFEPFHQMLSGLNLAAALTSEAGRKFASYYASDKGSDTGSGDMWEVAHAIRDFRSRADTNDDLGVSVEGYIKPKIDQKFYAELPGFGAF